MRLLDKSDLIALQRNLEDSLTRFAGTELREAAADVTELAVYEAARTYLGRPSKRLLGMTFLVSCHALSSSTAEHDPKHLLAVATALEIRHAGILLHDDIVDGDVVRGGQPTAHHALAASSFGAEGRNAAIFVGDLLAALAPLPILRSGLTPCEKARLVDAMLVLTARVAAGQAEQLHLDTACDIEKISELDILRAHAATFSPYLNCSIHLATILAGIENNVARCILECAVPIGQGFQVQNDLAGLIELDKQLRSGEPDTLTLANTSDLARGRCTALVRAALDRVTGADRARLVAYLSGDNSIDIKDIIDLIRVSGALTHCDTLIANLFAQARRNIAEDPNLPPTVRKVLVIIWQYMFDLYDPYSDVSRLYLLARPNIRASN